MTIEKCAGNSKDELFESFLVALKERGRSQNTIKTYHIVLQSFCLWLEERNRCITTLTQKDIQSYMDFLDYEEKSPATIDKIFNTLNVFARHIGKAELTEDIKRKTRTKEDITAPVAFTKKELEKLLKRIKDKGNLRNTAIVYTLLHTGIRVSELCSLNKSDIEKNRETYYLKIRKQKEGKERTIPLSSTCFHSISEYIASRDDNSDALFLSNYAKPISVRTVQHMLQQYEANPHKLRHTFCYGLIEKGIDISIVAELAGHSDINVTKQYIRSTNRDKLAKDIDQAFA